MARFSWAVLVVGFMLVALPSSNTVAAWASTCASLKPPCPSNPRVVVHCRCSVDEHEADHEVPLGVDPFLAVAMEDSLYNMQALMMMMMDTDDTPSSSSAAAWQKLLLACREVVRVGPSWIPNAGRGLLARKDLEPGTIVGFYPLHGIGVDTGANVVPIAAINEIDQEYFATQQHPDGHNYRQYLLGNRPPFGDNKIFIDVNPQRPRVPGWNSHIVNDGATILLNDDNHHHHEARILKYYQQSLQAQNCLLIPFGPVAPLMATITTKRIAKDEELLTCYGANYWLAESNNKTKNESSTTTATPDIQRYIEQSASMTREAIQQAKSQYEKEWESSGRLLRSLSFDAM